MNFETGQETKTLQKEANRPSPKFVQQVTTRTLRRSKAERHKELKGKKK